MMTMMMILYCEIKINIQPTTLTTTLHHCHPMICHEIEANLQPAMTLTPESLWMTSTMILTMMTTPTSIVNHMMPTPILATTPPLVATQDPMDPPNLFTLIYETLELTINKMMLMRQAFMSS